MEHKGFLRCLQESATDPCLRKINFDFRMFLLLKIN